MKCQQCGRNAIGTFGPTSIPLCLQCWSLLQQTVQKQNEALREEINYLHDSVDSMFGISTGPRYPTKRAVVVSGGTINNNHIAINNSQVGVVNTGNINSLNQTIDTLYAASQENLADGVRAFSESVLADENLDEQTKGQVIESLDVVTEEILRAPDNRRKLMASTLIDGISSAVALAANSLTVWQALHPLLQGFF